MVKEAEVRQTIVELERLQYHFGYETMPIRGIITMLNWLLRPDPTEDTSMLRGILGDPE